VGRFKNLSISAFTKIREPILNSTIIQICITDADDIYLLTENGTVHKSINMKSVIDMRFEEVQFDINEEKIVKIAPGAAFITIITEKGRCFSLLDDDKSTLIASGKLKDLRAIDINAGSQHVLVSTMLRSEDENGNEQIMLNKTYTINFKKITEMGNGEENYQEPETGEKIRTPLELAENFSPTNEKVETLSLIESEESIRGNIVSRATTLECKDTESSGHSSANNLSPNHSDTTIKFIDNGIEKVLETPDPGEI
jgi:hypothetical protein